VNSVKARILGLFPDELKAAIQPIHNWIQRIIKRGQFDASSGLGIQSLGRFQVAYRKGTADERVLGHSFDHDIFFSGVPEYESANDHVIIDVGAHIGTFSLLASSRVSLGKVFAIEASEDSFNLLRINVALNTATNVSVHHLALSDRRGKCTLYHDAGTWGHTVVKPLSAEGETVECCTLSDFLESNGIDRCHFMRLNCEGAEFPILLSTPSSVLQRCQIILVLYHCDLWRSNTEADLLSYFQSSGFNTALRNRSGKRGWIIATRAMSTES
jgi:FkbM family methyltransferase